jgi:hypothetical protein
MPISRGHDIGTVGNCLVHANPAMTTRVYAPAVEPADGPVAVMVGKIRSGHPRICPTSQIMGREAGTAGLPTVHLAAVRFHLPNPTSGPHLRATPVHGAGHCLPGGGSPPHQHHSSLPVGTADD